MLAWYADRAGYLMAIGRPAAQVGLYHPVNSMWMGDQDADRGTTKLGWQLFEHQVDWDYFDEQSLSSVAHHRERRFPEPQRPALPGHRGASLDGDHATGLERFRAFVKAGGKLIFVGKTPTLVVGQDVPSAKEAPDLSFATLVEPSGDITSACSRRFPNRT